VVLLVELAGLISINRLNGDLAGERLSQWRGERIAVAATVNRARTPESVVLGGATPVVEFAARRRTRFCACVAVC
jgi:hypothetical protein